MIGTIPFDTSSTPVLPGQNREIRDLYYGHFERRQLWIRDRRDSRDVHLSVTDEWIYQRKRTDSVAMNQECPPNVLLVAAFAFACLVSSAHAGSGPFDSGSTGIDGVLDLAYLQANFPEDPMFPGVHVFDPSSADLLFALENGFYRYDWQSVEIPSGVEVLLSARLFMEGMPIVWVVAGDVTVTGTLNLTGEKGSDFLAPTFGVPFAGAGGYNGGISDPLGGRTAGNGPGGGVAGSGGGFGGNGLHRLVYGNAFALPLTGGSGGGGTVGAGGGAGGGAILIASSGTIRVDGAIDCRGGASGFSGSNSGGPGSGGSIRLMANRVEGIGDLNVDGGESSTPDPPSGGWLRIEAFKQVFSGSLIPGTVTYGRPSTSLVTAIPSDGPVLQIAQIDGVSITFVDPSNPDVAEINATGPVPVTVDATGLCDDTMVSLRIEAIGGGVAPSLYGPVPVASGVAIVPDVVFPNGEHRVIVFATWDPALLMTCP